jgi:hypothetical protein
MLVELTTQDGSPLYINPGHVVAVCEEKHFGRPGVGQAAEYRDTLIVTTRGSFNARESPADVALHVNRAMRAGSAVDAVEQGEGDIK